MFDVTLAVLPSETHVLCNLSNYSAVDLVSTDVNPLSLALDNLVTWSNEWQLSININKTNVLHMGKNNPKITYKINNVIISPTKHGVIWV